MQCYGDIWVSLKEVRDRQKIKVLNLLYEIDKVVGEEKNKKEKKESKNLLY